MKQLFSKKSLFSEQRWLYFPLLSIFILTLGNGFYTTLTTLDLSLLTNSELTIGVISSAYFIGIILGSYFPQYTLRRLGFQKAFFLHALINACVTLLQTITDSLVVWFAIRLALGYCIGASFFIVESWFLSKSSPQKRGFIYACYLCTYYVAQSLGQLFLELNVSHRLFYFLISACYLSAAIIFLGIYDKTSFKTSEQKKINIVKLIQDSPLSIYTAFCYGIFTGVVYSMLPYFATVESFSNHQISVLMLCTIIGGTVPQFIIGYLTDNKDVYTWLFILCSVFLLSTIACLNLIHSFYLFCLFSFITGASGFCLYNFAVKMTMQHVTKAQTLSAVSTLLIIYSSGTVFGPLLCSVLMHFSGSHGYFYTLLSMTAFILLFSFRGIQVKTKSPVPL